jgi:2-keto-3-deoxy-L-rhamnonate aldolase RhmA
MQDEMEPCLVGRRAIEDLIAGVPLAALGVRMARTTDIVRIAKGTGHKAIWVDLEHSTMSVDTAAAICASALDLGMLSLVRVPENDHSIIGRLLDGGALGIIAPRIETVEEAEAVVSACRFPPLGHRSAVATLPHVAYRRMPATELQSLMNRATIVKILIESPRGIENLEGIASLPGVDIIGIGSNDLSAELGVAGDVRHPKMRAAHDVALAVCAAQDIPLAIGGIADPQYAAELIQRGAAPFLFTAIDSDLLHVAAKDRIDRALAALKPRA